MGHQNDRSSWKKVLRLAAGQHGVVSRGQLLGLGVSSQGVKHRRSIGLLHLVHRGVYAVGRRQLSRDGVRMAATLACGQGAVLSHLSAAELWGLGFGGARIEVSVPAARTVRRPGIRVHRRSLEPADVALERAIPVTSPVRTLVDLALRLDRDRLEAAVNDADRRDLCDPEGLRNAVDGIGRAPGSAALRRMLDRRTFTLTDSQLERRFLPIAHRAGLGRPLTRRIVNGYRVDFFWPALGLVVETDGLRYHRTPARQSRDARRDQVHTAAGMTTLRFTHEQVAYRPTDVEATLRAVAARLMAR